MTFFSIQQPERSSHVFVNVPHAGLVIPDAVSGTIVAPELEMHRDADWAVDRLFAGACEAGAGLMSTTISRYVVDLNRDRRDLPADALDFEWNEHPEKSYGRRGLFWLETTRGVPVVTQKLSQKDVEARLAYYDSYHQALALELSQRKEQFGAAILIDGHSMPSVGRAGHPDEGVRRADVVLGDSFGRSCSSLLVHSATGVFERAGYSVALNEPYSGGYDTVHYGRPQNAMHALQIELNRDCYMDEEALAMKPTEAVRLTLALNDVVRAVQAIDLGFLRSH